MRRGLPYVVTGVLFAGICAWISYNDGLFVARLAGNHDALAYFYPLLPDGLIVLCLLALAEAARAGTPRSRWAVGGLLLGIALTLAMNTYAGIEHSVLDAVLDGMVPVVFFIAAEVVLWHVRHGRPVPAAGKARGAVPSSVTEAARMRLQLAAEHGFKVTPEDTRKRWGLTRAAARELHAEFAPQGSPAGDGLLDVPAAPAGVNGNRPHG